MYIFSGSPDTSRYGALCINNDQHSRDLGVYAMASWMIVLLMLVAPMPPHNFDNTDTLGAMMPS